MCPEMFSKARSRGSGASEGEGEAEGLMEEYEKPTSRSSGLPRSVKLAGGAVLVLVAFFSLGGSKPDKSTLRVATWNIAAVNNNPFEYWITHDDADYNKLMEDVQSFIDQPGERDVPVSQVFTPAMWAELKALMAAQGWGGIEQTDAMWQSSFGQRKIIAEFMKDPTLGEKRLASMPDRVTNTINLAGGTGVANRPTVINCFGGDMTTTAKWWANWKRFMFEQKLMIEGGSAPAPHRDRRARRNAARTARTRTHAHTHAAELAHRAAAAAAPPRRRAAAPPHRRAATGHRPASHQASGRAQAGRCCLRRCCRRSSGPSIPRSPPRRRPSRSRCRPSAR